MKFGSKPVNIPPCLRFYPGGNAGPGAKIVRKLLFDFSDGNAFEWGIFSSLHTLSRTCQIQ